MININKLFRSLYSKINKLFIVFRNLDIQYIIPGVKILFLQSLFYLFRTVAGIQTACNIFRNIKVVISFRNIKFSVNAIPGDIGFILECFVNKTYEPIESFIPKEGDTCLDIGANVGSCVLNWYVKNSSGKLICCEPQPFTFKRLQKNVDLNNCNNIEALQIAISNHNGPMEIFISENASMAVVNSTGLKSKYITKAYTLDHLVNKRLLKKIDLCKIDVEGYEIEVLEGANETLRKIRRLIIECHSDILNKKVKEIIEQHFTIVKEVGSDVSLIFAENNDEIERRILQ